MPLQSISSYSSSNNVSFCRKICNHCVKSVQIRSYFWSIFSCIRIEYRKIRTRNNSVFGHFSRSEYHNWINPFQCKVAFNTETTHLIRTANQINRFLWKEALGHNRLKLLTHLHHLIKVWLQLIQFWFHLADYVTAKIFITFFYMIDQAWVFTK